MSNEADEITLRLFKEEMAAGKSAKEAKLAALSRRAALDAIGAGDSKKDFGAPVPFREDYLATPSDIRGSRGETISVPEALARGGARGVTLRNADEIAGVVGAMGQGLAENVGYVDPMSGKHQQAPKSGQSTREMYETKRDAYRNRDKAAEEDRPLATRGMEFAGSTVVAPAFGGADKLGRAVLTGGKMAAPYTLGASETSALDHPVKLALEVGGGTLAGGVGGAAGFGAANTVSGTGRWLLEKLGRRSRVQDVARDSAQIIAADMDRPSALGKSDTTVGQSLMESREIMNDAKGRGYDLQFTPAQASGSRAQGLRELRARHTPADMDEAQRFELQQLENAAGFADTYVREIANNPDRIGSAAVAENAGKAVSRHGDKLLDVRSVNGRRLYGEAKAAGGGVDYVPIKQVFDQEIAENNIKIDNVTGIFGDLYKKLEKAGAGGGLSLEELNAGRSKLLGVIRGKQSLLGSAMARDPESAMAGRLLDAFNKQFVAAESTSSGPAALLWRRANEQWRLDTEAYQNAMTDTIEKLLKMSGSDKVGDIPQRLLDAGPGPMRAVFSILRKESPADAADLRAQLMETILVKGGKPSKLSPTSNDLGLDKISAGSIVDMLKAKKYGPALEAAFEGDPKALFALRRMGELFQRVGFGPNLKGSPTYPQLADAFDALGGSALDKMAAGNGYTALALQTIRKNLEAVTGNAKVASKAFTTHDGIEAINNALGLILDGKSGKTITEKAARNAIGMLTSAGIIGADALSSASQKPTRSAQPPAQQIPMQREPLPEGLVGLGRGQPIAGEAYPQ